MFLIACHKTEGKKGFPFMPWLGTKKNGDERLKTPPFPVLQALGVIMVMVDPN